MEMKALRFIGSGSPAYIAIPRMDFALEKHLPSKLFMFNELAFSNIFCPLAPALTPNLGHYNFKFWSFGKEQEQLDVNWLWNEQGQALSREGDLRAGILRGAGREQGGLRDQFQSELGGKLIPWILLEWQESLGMWGGSSWRSWAWDSSGHGDEFTQPELWFSKTSPDTQRCQLQLCQPQLCPAASFPESFQDQTPCLGLSWAALPQPGSSLGCPQQSQSWFLLERGSWRGKLPGGFQAGVPKVWSLSLGVKTGHEIPHLIELGFAEQWKWIPMFSHPYIEVANQHAEKDEWQNSALF